MDISTQNKGYRQPSIAATYKQLDHPRRKDIINILYNYGPQAFRIIGERLEIDRAALAYHLRILRNANLIENFYDNIKDSKSYSYYRLTDYARWLLNNDLSLSLESQQYHPLERSSDVSVEEDVIDEKGDQIAHVVPNITSSDKRASIIEEDFKVVKDPRVRYSKYKISL
jgi:DNA-binding transcriptional ArsR family regulator